MASNDEIEAEKKAALLRNQLAALREKGKQILAQIVKHKRRVQKYQQLKAETARLETEIAKTEKCTDQLKAEIARLEAEIAKTKILQSEIQADTERHIAEATTGGGNQKGACTEGKKRV